MSNKNIENIQLSFQCLQNWDEMRVSEGGKFCTLCQKTVFDFTTKNQAQFDRIQEQFKGEVCGRFHRSQLNLAKIAGITSLLLGANEVSHAQTVVNQNITPIHKDSIPAKKSADNGIFFGAIVEPMPSFIGGEKALFKFLSENIQYPKDTVNGTVYLGFTVGVDGHLKNMVVKRGVKGYPSFELEALRVLKLTSGKWQAGKQQGIPVETKFTMPVRFQRD